MFNKVMLIGRLGANPELRYTQGDTPVATLRLATSEFWTDKQSGERKESTEWHRVIVWGKQAEQVEKFLKKGRLCFVEGSLQTREWQDREGNKRWSTEIRATNVRFLDRGDNHEQRQGQPERTHRDERGPDPELTPPAEGFSDDDIPF